MGSAQGPLGYRVEYDTKTRTTTIIKGQECVSLPISIFDYLQQHLQQISITAMPHLPFEFQGGFIGYFGYELNQETAPIVNAKSSPHPDAHFLFLDRFIVFDHQEHTCYLAALSSKLFDPAVAAWFAETENHLINTSA
jgi:para-aminobenzoate synthetase